MKWNAMLEDRKEQVWHSPNFPLITRITESSLRHAPVVERAEGQRWDGWGNLVTEATGGEPKQRVQKTNLITIQKTCDASESGGEGTPAREDRWTETVVSDRLKLYLRQFQQQRLTSCPATRHAGDWNLSKLVLKGRRDRHRIKSLSHPRFPLPLRSAWVDRWRRNPEWLSIYPKRTDLTCEGLRFAPKSNYLPEWQLWEKSKEKNENVFAAVLNCDV